MAEDASSHQYEDIRIGENAVVHLGDKRVTHKKEINIQTAYLFLQDELDLPRLNIAQVLPSASLERGHLDKKSSVRCQDTTQIERQSSDRNKYRVAAFANATNSKGCSAFRAGFQKPAIQTSQQKHNMLWMRRFLPDFAASSNQQSASLVRASGSSGFITPDGPMRHDNPNATALIRPGQEFLVLLTFVLSCLIGRNASPQEVSAMLAKCQRDPLLPLLTAAMAFGLARYLQTRRVITNPSSLDEFKIMLEDAYGVQSFVSMSICADYSIFKSFLETHYRKAGRKAGEMLVKADQFHLTLGSRRGALMNADNWEVEKGSNIVNSLYLVTEDQSCLLCKGPLIVGKTGDLHCLDCDVFFRDYDALRPRFPAPKKVPRDASPSSRGVPTDSQQKLDTLDYVQYLDDTQIELEGLQHIDIRIVSTRLRPRPAIFSDYNEDALWARGPGDDMVEIYDRTHARPVKMQEAPTRIDIPPNQTDKVTRRNIFDDEIDYDGPNIFEDVKHEPRNSKPKSILKPPRAVPFPEDPNFVREGVAPLSEVRNNDIPHGARWTKISRLLVDPEALEMAEERFEVREDHVIVLRVLSRREIDVLAEKTRLIREERENNLTEKVQTRKGRRPKKGNGRALKLPRHFDFIDLRLPQPVTGGSFEPPVGYSPPDLPVTSAPAQEPMGEYTTLGEQYRDFDFTFTAEWR